MKLLKMFSFILLQATLFSAPWWAYSQPGTRFLKCATETVTWSCPGTPIANPTSTTPQACIDQRQAGAGNATIYAITVAVTGATGTVTYAWPTPEGPIQFVTSTGTPLTGTQTGPTVWIRATTPIAVANQNWGKARLKCEYSITGGPCGCKGFATLDLFKRINSTIFPIIGPTCITTDGTPYTFSVDPVFSRNVGDGIGVDSYTWSPVATNGAFVPVYQSGDNSSRTFTFTATGTVPNTYTLGLTSGATCNNTPAPTRTLQLGSPAITINTPTFGTPSTAYSIPPGQTAPRANWELCLDADKSSTLTLQISNYNPLLTYTWEALSGFTLTSQSGASATFTPTATATRAQGSIRVTTPATSGGCSGSSANVTVYRRLSSAYSIVRPTAPTVIDNCLTPGTQYTFTLQGPAGNLIPPATTNPTNASYEWTLPSSANGWSFVGSTNGTSVICRVAPGSASPSPVLGPSCRLVNTGGLSASCNVVVASAGTPYNISGPKTYSVTLAQVPGTNFYTTTFNGGYPAGTNYANYLFEWFYSSAAIQPSVNDDAAWTLFANSNTPCNQNQLTNTNLPGWLYCKVTGRLTGGPTNCPTTNPLPPCATAACATIVSCLSLRTPPVASLLQRPGGGNPIKYNKLDPSIVQSVLVVPNPGKEIIEIQGEGFTKPGKLFVIGMDGKVVFENQNFILGAKVDIHKLPKGVFKVLFQNEEGELNTTFQKE